MNFHQWRQQHTAVPGGTVRTVNRPAQTDLCCCFMRDLTPADITHFVTTDNGALWAVYRRCELHGCCATSPVWSPEIGTLHGEPPTAGKTRTTAGTVAREDL